MTPRPHLPRTTGERAPRSKLSIYCDASRTEPQYFDQEKRRLRGLLSSPRFGPIVKVVAIPGADPVALVDRAIQDLREDNLPGDEWWCVFDAEAPEPRPNLERAISLAGDNNIQCAISNPCFELWLILYYINQTAYLTTDRAIRLAEQLVPGYSGRRKHVRLDRMPGDHAVPCGRAQALDQRNLEAGDGLWANPSTSVWRLADRLLERFNITCSVPGRGTRGATRRRS
jgi:hypothetical protein